MGKSDDLGDLMGGGDPLHSLSDALADPRLWMTPHVGAAVLGVTEAFFRRSIAPRLGGEYVQDRWHGRVYFMPLAGALLCEAVRMTEAAGCSVPDSIRA